MQYFHIIYKLTFPNTKVYIGQTNNFNRRMNGYKSDAYNNSEKNKKYNSYISNAIRKYGWENIQQDILFTVTEDFVDKLETKMIAEYNSTNKEFGYNFESGGNKNKTFKPSERTKKIWSEQRKGKNNPMFGKKRPDLVERNKLKNMIGKNNPMFGVHRFGEDSPMYGKKHTELMKEKLRKPKTQEHIDKIRKSHLGKKQLKETIEKRIRKIQKSINVYHKNGNFINSFNSIIEAGNTLNVHPQNISSVCRGKLKQSGGYIFKYSIGNQNAI